MFWVWAAPLQDQAHTSKPLSAVGKSERPPTLRVFPELICTFGRAVSRDLRTLWLTCSLFEEEFTHRMIRVSLTARPGGYCLSRWWIIRSPLQIHFGLVFSSWGSPDRPPHPEVRPHPTSSAGTFTDFSMTWHCPASGLSGSQAGTGGKGQASTSRAVHRRLVLPAAIGFSSLPVTLSHQLATSRSWLPERHS
jgi:hypothetical protein